MTKQQLTKIILEFINENGDNEYYHLAELYRSLDQYAQDNDLVIADADKWI